MQTDHSSQSTSTTKHRENALNLRGNPFDDSLVRNELLHEIFEETVRTKPDKIALIYNNTHFTYQELNTRANRLANYLRSQGVGKGKFVGVYLPRGMEVYVVILAILKAGGAYVPFDPEFPVNRIIYGLIDSKAIALISNTDLIPNDIHLPCNSLFLNQLWDIIDQQPDTPLTRKDTELTPNSSAYAICTSGTTGRPKCVEISHRSVCHFTRASNLILEIYEEDIFYQGFSIAFDASIEEIWLSFLVGATLFVGTHEIVHSGTELAAILSNANVTMLSCVPTLLAMLEDDIPTVRQINFAGEACPPELVKRWHKEGRRIFNTYGPTEATITSTIAELAPEGPITIGRPLPNYTAYILNDQMELVQPGEAGELHIGGIGLAKGYMNKPDLTAKKFVPNPYFHHDMQDPLLYKTGDLARFTPSGDIEFLGRIDTQIKLRGFRIELAEIETVLMEHSDIRTAVVDLHKDKQGIDRLVAYIVMREGKPFTKEELRAHAALRLPSYMVPGLLQPIEHLPLLASGKVDRKQLPIPEFSHSAEEIIPPSNETEKTLVTLWEKFFPEAAISIDADFFIDLGGHSLLAAKCISELRTIPEFSHVSMRDIYQHTTIRSLAIAIMQEQPTRKVTSKKRDETSTKRYIACSIAQGVALYFIFGIYTFLGLMGPYIIYHWMVTANYSIAVATITALCSLVLMIPIVITFPIIGKWLIIGRYKAGEYPLWGSYYFRWWLVKQLTGIVPSGYLVGNPFLALYLGLFGMKIGKNTYLGTDAFDTYDLITIGDDSNIGSDSIIMSAKVEDGLLKIGPITIGKNCYIGSSCIVEHNTVMTDGSALEDLSLLPTNSIIPKEETWAGSPAQQCARNSVTPPIQARPKWITRFCFGLMQTIMLFVFPMVVMLPLFPSMELLYLLNPTHQTSLYILYSPLFAFTYILLFCIEIIILKQLLVGHVKPGTYSTYSGFYLRKWMFDQFMDFSLGVMHSIYATLYLVPWYRMLGIKVGKGSEVSTATTLCPDVLHIGDNCFIADGVFLGVQRVQNGQVVIKQTSIGNNSFIGNSAIIPTGTKIGEQCLVGCLSLPPNNKNNLPINDISCFGSPSELLPARQKMTNFANDVTLKPAKKLVFQRLCIEFLRILFPLTCYTILFICLLHIMLSMIVEYQVSLWIVGLIFPLLSISFGLSLALITFVVKELLIGTYKPIQIPLWSNYVWRTEFVTAVYESLLVPFFISSLTGTPYINWVLRLLGCKIGKQVFTNTTDITEFDLVNVDDYSALNQGADLQTHTFEDRVMKISQINIGKFCTVGSLSVVLFDTVMEDGSTLGSLSLLMKGETLPADTHWEGSPARPVKD